MLRWVRKDNQRYAGDADCQAAYGDNEATAREHLYVPRKILGFVTPMAVDWNGETNSALLGGVMAAFLIPSGNSPTFTILEVAKHQTFS
jgi:hypothetical protein